MNYLEAVVLGIVQGLTEFLPISSTGHLLIAEHWLGERSETFNVVIQAGAMARSTTRLSASIRRNTAKGGMPIMVAILGAPFGMVVVEPAR